MFLGVMFWVHNDYVVLEYLLSPVAAEAGGTHPIILEEQRNLQGTDYRAKGATL